MAQPSPQAFRRDWTHSPHVRSAVAAAVGVVGGLLDRAFGLPEIALLVCGDVGTIVFVGWVFLASHGQTGEQTRALATQEVSGRAAFDAIILGASLAALVAVGVVLSGASGEKGVKPDILAGVGVLSVVCAWFLVHTVFMLRYARLYFAEPEGGVDFNSEEVPSLVEFAYLAFTLGMTYQVSDTDIKKREIRRAALHHGLLSYLFGTVIIATTINLVAGLGK